MKETFEELSVRAINRDSNRLVRRLIHDRDSFVLTYYNNPIGILKPYNGETIKGKEKKNNKKTA